MLRGKLPTTPHLIHANQFSVHRLGLVSSTGVCMFMAVHAVAQPVQSRLAVSYILL